MHLYFKEIHAFSNRIIVGMTTILAQQEAETPRRSLQQRYLSQVHVKSPEDWVSCGDFGNHCFCTLYLNLNLSAKL
jgi:hypothetical protein